MGWQLSGEHADVYLLFAVVFLKGCKLDKPSKVSGKQTPCLRVYSEIQYFVFLMNILPFSQLILLMIMTSVKETENQLLIPPQSSPKTLGFNAATISFYPNYLFEQDISEDVFYLCLCKIRMIYYR